jgi:hypothetical protein
MSVRTLRARIDERADSEEVPSGDDRPTSLDGRWTGDLGPVAVTMA